MNIQYSQLEDNESTSGSPRQGHEVWQQASRSSRWPLYLAAVLALPSLAVLSLLATNQITVHFNSTPDSPTLEQISAFNVPPADSYTDASIALSTLPTVVGSRLLNSSYFGLGCSSAELLQDLSRAVLRPDGLSRQAPTSETVFAPNNIQFSFDLPNCPPLHVFSVEEACDLLAAYGGVYLFGDSLVRHFDNALQMVLSGRPDGASTKEGLECAGEKMFDDGKTCRFTSVRDAQTAKQAVCQGRVALHYEAYSSIRPTTVNEPTELFRTWAEGRDTLTKLHSPCGLPVRHALFADMPAEFTYTRLAYTMAFGPVRLLNLALSKSLSLSQLRHFSGHFHDISSTLLHYTHSLFLCGCLYM